jgi:hypothetical protein
MSNDMIQLETIVANNKRRSGRFEANFPGDGMAEDRGQIDAD